MTRLKIFLLVLLTSALAMAEVVPVPPQFVEPVQLPGEDPFSISKPAFSPDGAYVAAYIHGAKMLTVWDVKTQKVVAEIPESVHGVDSPDGLDFSLDGKHLLLLRNILPMKTIDWRAGKVVKELDLKADPKKIWGYAYGPKQNLLALGTSDGIALWDLAAGKKLKQYQKGENISGLDILVYTPPNKPTVRLLAYSRALVPPNNKFEHVAGIINLDTDKVTTILDDVPADKKIQDKTTYTGINFEYGGGHVLVTYFVFPPTVNAGAYLVNTWTGKYLANHELGQKTIAYLPKYLWKPYYGFVISTADLSQPMQPYGVATQFLVTTKDALKPIKTYTEADIPVQSLRFSNDNTKAAIVHKAGPSDPAKLFLYKVVPAK
ncbi:MAG: WD40 repeat domain-containing protein [Vulcanimicrobiota bacterium]